jgi:hypothetical protein
MQQPEQGGLSSHSSRAKISKIEATQRDALSTKAHKMLVYKRKVFLFGI